MYFCSGEVTSPLLVFMTRNPVAFSVIMLYNLGVKKGRVSQFLTCATHFLLISCHCPVKQCSLFEVKVRRT